MMLHSLTATFCLLLIAGAKSADVVKVGAGSYATRLPDGAKALPAEIIRTTNVKGPMPTNDWWSSLAWKPFGDTMFPHPLAVRAMPAGLRVAYPKITANDSAIFGSMPTEPNDFIIGHSAVENFADARVDGFSDWFVDLLFADGAKTMRASFGHGSPLVFFTFEGGNPTLTFGKEAPKVWSGSEPDAVLGITANGRHYGIFAPSGSTWSDLGATKWTAETNGKGYFSVAVLPEANTKTLGLLSNHAHAHVTGSEVRWLVFGGKDASVNVRFALAQRRLEGQQNETAFALYPHQWRHYLRGGKGIEGLSAQKVSSVRGEMKIQFEGHDDSFTESHPSLGLTPFLPLPSSFDRNLFAQLLAVDLTEKPKLVGDTYWLGKQLGKWTTLLPLAEQTGNAAAAAELTTRIKASLENFFTATDARGALKKADAGLFYYDANWGTLIGFPASYGSDTELNDHHFHYGYFIRAAAEIALRDPAWGKDWGGMVRLLIDDIACADRKSTQFPFLRCFDPYAGHSWASGHANFADGNNNESSSEAVNAWLGIILWATATKDRALRDLGVWLFTTEIEAINAYWFDVTNEFHHPDYKPSVVTMVWGGKGANGTWFSGNPELVHGINWLPFTGASLYLGRYPEYCAKNYAALVEENRADDAKKAAKDGGNTQPGDGTNWDQWADLIWMYRALSDPADARRQFEARAADFKPEGGNSLANAYAWITSLEAYGHVDRTVTADSLFHAVFTKAGKKTHIAWNPDAEPRTVTFSDGVTVNCEARSYGVR